ncbi:MAG TPA: type II secretion system F family protein [Syntrophomonadaceae bacterium]|nr:type II secretion system F family protein [Syntrophomonadaceae bacterium]
MGGVSYNYRARNLSGRLITGKVEAGSPGEAIALLREKNLFVVKLSPVRSLNIDLDRVFKRRIAVRDLAVFCRQFATMAGAGIPLLQCLNILAGQTENKKLRGILVEVAGEIEKGKGLSESFRGYREHLPEIFINMLVAGEVSGTIEQTLERLAVHFEKDHQLREKIKSAMAYPAMIAGMALLSVLVLITLIVPIFADIFAQSGAVLPLPTRILMGISGALTGYWYLFLAGMAGLFVAARQGFASESGRKFVDRLLLQIPVVGPLATKTIVSRFSRTLATLLRSGIPLLRSLETVEKAVGNSIAAKEIAEAMRNIKEGERMAPVLIKSKIFPPMAVNMIGIGEESGALDSMLEKLAAFYEQEVEAMIARLSSIVEPLLIAVVGILVGFIAISIYFPLFGLSGAIQGGGMPGGMP